MYELVADVAVEAVAGPAHVLASLQPLFPSIHCAGVSRNRGMLRSSEQERVVGSGGDPVIGPECERV